MSKKSAEISCAEIKKSIDVCFGDMDHTDEVHLVDCLSKAHIHMFNQSLPGKNKVQCPECWKYYFEKLRRSFGPNQSK